MDYLIILNFDDTECINNYLTKTKFKILISPEISYFQESDRLQARTLNECTLPFNFIINITKPYFIDFHFLKTLPASDYDFFRQFNDTDHDITGRSSTCKKTNNFTKTLVLPKFTVLYKGKYITV